MGNKKNKGMCEYCYSQWSCTNGFEGLDVRGCESFKFAEIVPTETEKISEGKAILIEHNTMLSIVQALMEVGVKEDEIYKALVIWLRRKQL